MKEDTPPPRYPPTKRRQIERVPDFWLATWATDESLPQKERDRAQEERQRRKDLVPHFPVGILVDYEGATEEQVEALRDALRTTKASEIHHPWSPRAVHGVCRATGVPVIVHKDVRSNHAALREVVVSSKSVIAMPRGRERVGSRSPAWDSIAYARHRSLPVTILMPDGTINADS